PWSKGPYKDAKINVVVVKSDNRELQSAARGPQDRCSVVIQQRETGNVNIMVSQRPYDVNGKGIYQVVGRTRMWAAIDVRDVVRLIRMKEQKLAGFGRRMSWDELEADGSIAGAMCWHYRKVARCLHNGTLTHNKVPPTLIPLAQIVELVRLGLSASKFEPN